MARRRLLVAGILAGPLFIALTLAQAYTRDGFDLSYHPISLLSLGDGGWLQIANFVIAGALGLAGAAGLRTASSSGPGQRWGPRLVGLLGVGLILAGVFVTSAGAGFPPGAPAGAPAFGWNDAVHTLGFGLATVGAVGASLVYARRFASAGQWWWCAACLAGALATVSLLAWPGTDGLSVRLLAATAAMFATVATVAAHALVASGAWNSPRRPEPSPAHPRS